MFFRNPHVLHQIVSEIFSAAEKLKEKKKIIVNEFVSKAVRVYRILLLKLESMNTSDSRQKQVPKHIHVQ